MRSTCSVVDASRCSSPRLAQTMAGTSLVTKAGATLAGVLHQSHAVTEATCMRLPTIMPAMGVTERVSLVHGLHPE